MWKRTLKKVIQKLDQAFPVILVTGPRQVGKTTLLAMAAKTNRNYVTLDDLDVRTLAQNDPGLFMQTYQAPLIIDEVQYAPQLFSYIKLAVDNAKRATVKTKASTKGSTKASIKSGVNGMYWLTGSQKFHLMKGITESLAGRVAIVDLLGLSQAELSARADKVTPFLPTNDWVAACRKNVKKSPTLKSIYKRIWLGSFPHLNQIDSSNREVFYSSYIQTYIQRDVKDVLKISDESSFYRLLVALAARTGQVLNYADLSRDVGVDSKTVKAWISVLETSGLIFRLQPYFNNVTKRLVISSPKIYFLDTGLCTYLTKWPTPESLEAGSMSGAVLETYLFSEILKSYWHNGKEAHFYYYRDRDQNEIDLVIESGNCLYPVEFKKTGSPSITAAKHFQHLEKLGKKVGHGAVICFVDKEVPLSRMVTAVPVGYL